LTLAPRLLADGQGSTFDATVGPVGFVVKVVATHFAPGRRLAMRSVESVVAEAGVGLAQPVLPADVAPELVAEKPTIRR
jgi:hypothetical protein